jgi:Na+-transporting methylmalonyl-CoA/oxaloacetate decarboxylase gamma subunit
MTEEGKSMLSRIEKKAGMPLVFLVLLILFLIFCVILMPLLAFNVCWPKSAAPGASQGPSKFSSDLHTVRYC